jgi:3-phenylpropionate/trans-cinnamate dioxygenase ferredoxin reductase subunit
VAIAERTLDDGGRAAVVYRDEAPLHTDRLSALRERGATVLVLGADAPLAEAVTDALAAFEEPPQAFVYGFAPFLDDATAALSAAGADTEAAKIESFGPAPGSDD